MKFEIERLLREEVKRGLERYILKGYGLLREGSDIKFGVNCETSSDQTD